MELRITARQRREFVRFLELLAKLPDDASCHTCDYLTDKGMCRKWHAEPPDDAKDIGCDEWQDHGAPF